MLDDYKDYHFINDQISRQNLVNGVWKELENYGLKNNSFAVLEQLECYTVLQKKELRAMILSRIKSFQSLSRKIIEAKELQQAPLNNKNSQVSNSTILEDSNKQLIEGTQDIQELLKRNKDLIAQVKDLIKENSKQQAALDNLTNAFWNDDESHNSKKLIQDITDLQDMLIDFTIVHLNDESEKSEVEVCGFPCIGIFTGDKLSDEIFIKSQIIPRSKRL
ncbi:hypothetical protein RhiirC2_797869 [Rhizophagus irregularis]|uniref:Uncharacterized protein n=1 Tax=Rhizophagus irregularis TaxID=588596 RepID=A0A2N1M7B2_9GLOM|nr:hypothetical protein RhiirC2_797869 [Rhizophagus irregularis]